jgi:hypothetical protein
VWGQTIVAAPPGKILLELTQRFAVASDHAAADRFAAGLWVCDCPDCSAVRAAGWRMDLFGRMRPPASLPRPNPLATYIDADGEPRCGRLAPW